MNPAPSTRADRIAAPAATAVVVAAFGAGDPTSTRLVYAMVGGLVVIGLLLILLGVWLIRQTRHDPPVLGPLERMGDADWRKRDEATQRRLLDDVRPEGAKPLRAEPAPPRLDSEFDLSKRPAESVIDLGPGLAPDTSAAAFPSPNIDDLVEGPLEPPAG